MNFAKPELLQDQWPMVLDLNDVISDNLGDDHGFVFERTYYVSFFQYTIVEKTINLIMLASIGVFVVLIFLMDLRVALFIILIVIQIDFCLFGWIVLCGLSLDSLAFLQLVMAVGLTVDYLIHIVHAIVDARVIDNDDDDNNDTVDEFNEKLKIAMVDMGVGVAKGAWTTFLGSIPLVFSQSEAFRRFFYLFGGIISIALAHGMLFVPSVLAQIKCIYTGIEHASNQADKKFVKENNDPKDIRNQMTESHKNTNNTNTNTNDNAKSDKEKEKEKENDNVNNTDGTDHNAQTDDNDASNANYVEMAVSK